MKFLSLLIFTVAGCLAAPTHEAAHYGYHGPPAPLGHDGRVVDTPEVAHAKAAHLAAFSEAASKSTYSVPSFAENGIHEYQQTAIHPAAIKHPGLLHAFSEPVLYSARTYHTNQGYHGPSAPLDHEGRVVDTPEVAHAKAAHFAAYTKAASNIVHAPVAFSEDYSELNNSPKYNAYHGPIAPLSHDGRVIDTPEVAQAKAAHLAAYAHAAHGRPYNVYGDY